MRVPQNMSLNLSTASITGHNFSLKASLNLVSHFAVFVIVIFI